MGKRVKVYLDYIELDCEDVEEALKRERAWLVDGYLEYDEEGKLWFCEPDREDCEDPGSLVCHDVTNALELCRGGSHAEV